MVRRVITPYERKRVAEMAAQGFDDTRIASELGWTHKTAARAVGVIRREITADPAKVQAISLEQMSKDERYRYVQDRFAANPRTRFVLDSFSKEERELFTQEYFNVLQATDSLTEVEDQQLFTGILEFVLAMKSLRMKQEEERLYFESMRGTIPKYIVLQSTGKTEPNPQYRGSLQSRFEDDYNSHIANYTKFMDSLKMSRKQRLDKIKQERRTLADIAIELSSSDAHASISEEIERLAKLEDATLKQMLENGYIMGLFGENP
jgi:hypothetical protein